MLPGTTIKSYDTRRLGFAEFGDPKGKAVIYFHGFPGSRLEVSRFNEIALKNNYRLIAVDRPGFGLSSLDKNRTILSTIKDIEFLAGYLQLDKFSVMGHSGGAVFVVACAYLIPERINNAAIISGMAPFADVTTHSFMAREQLTACKIIKVLPFMAWPMMFITRLMLKKSDKLLEKMIKPLPEIDKAIFRDPKHCREIIGSCLEAFRNGLAGATLEMNLIVKKWGFELKDIKFPVSIWHGQKDTQTAIANGRFYKSKMVNSVLREFPADGHHSIMINHFEEILLTL